MDVLISFLLCDLMMYVLGATVAHIHCVVVKYFVELVGG